MKRPAGQGLGLRGYERARLGPGVSQYWGSGFRFGVSDFELKGM